MSTHKIVRATLVAIPGGIAILFVAAFMILHSKSFQTYALNKITASIGKSTGARISVQSLKVNWRPLAVELSGITAENPAVVAKTPLLTANRLHVTMQIWPLLHRQVQIEGLVIDHPVVYVQTEPDGRNNLPTSPQSAQSSMPSMSIQIAHLVISDGLLQYDDRQIPLWAEVQGFRTQVHFDRLTNSYKGQIAYDTGRLQTAQMRTFDHRTEMQFKVDGRHCTIERCEVSTMHSQFTARGEVTNYKNPVFVGDYKAGISSDDVKWILKDATLPVGDIVLQGKLGYRTDAGNGWQDRVSVEGSAESAKLTVPSGQSRVAVEALHATYKLNRGRLEIANAKADVFSGRFASDSDVIDLVNNSGRVRFTLRSASMNEALRVATVQNPQAPQIAARADLDVAAQWKGSVSNAVGQIRSTLHHMPSSSPNAIPVDGNVVLDYDAARNRGSFQPSTLRTGNTQLALSGVLSKDSALRVKLTTRDLHELAALVSAAAPSANSRQIAAYDILGGADLSGNVSGAIADPHFDGQLSLTDLKVARTSWKTLRAHLSVDSKSVMIADGTLVGATQGRMTFDAKTHLVNWSPDPNSPFTAKVRIEQISTADFQRLANADYPVEGNLNGEISARGTQRQPVAHGRLELVKGVVYGQPLNLLAVNVNADKQTIHLNGDVRAAAGALTARLDYDPSSKRYQLTANTNKLVLERIDALQQSAGNVKGQLTGDVSGSGTLDNPGLTAHIQIPDLVVRGERLESVNVQLDAKGKHTEFRLASNVDQTTIQAKGSVELTPGYPASVTLDTGVVPIGPLLARFMPNSQSNPQQAADGKLELHATLQGPLQTPEQLQAHAEIPTLQLEAQAIKLANVAPIRMDYRGGVLQVANAELKGQDTDIRLNGSVPLQGKGNMNLTADGNVNLNLLQPWTDGGHSSGNVSVRLRAQGSKTQPAIDGQVKIQNGLFTSDDLPFGIESLNGDMAIVGNRLNISDLSARAGGGTVNVTGTATCGKDSSFYVAMQAKSVRIRQSGVRSIMNADLAWNGSMDSSLLSGRVSVDKLAFNEGSDLSEILGQFSDDETISEPSSFARNVKLNVAVQSSQNLNLASSQLSIAGSANLAAQGTAAQPIILGRVLLNSGEVFFLGKRFEIDNGTISFSNPVRTDPIVSLQVKTTVEHYNITASVTGPVDRLKTTYTSDPALPTGDIINLLAFGQTTAESASNAATPASLGAESAVAGAVGGQVASQVQKLTGISQLTLNPLAGNQNPGSQVAIQQRVSGNILLTFSTDITTTQNESVQIQYQAKPNITFSVLRDENGGYGIDVSYHKVF
jgi:translocation and assembly module TamB